MNWHDLHQVRELRDASHVERFHTQPLTRRQNLAEHSYGVVMLLLGLFPADTNIRVITAAMAHDLAEYHTGDLPAPVKWTNTILNKQIEEIESQWLERNGFECMAELTRYETSIISFCDGFELLLFSIEELERGNTSPQVQRMVANMIASLNRRVSDLPETVKHIYGQAKIKVNQILKSSF